MVIGRGVGAGGGWAKKRTVRLSIVHCCARRCTLALGACRGASPSPPPCLRCWSAHRPPRATTACGMRDLAAAAVGTTPCSRPLLGPHPSTAAWVPVPRWTLPRAARGWAVDGGPPWTLPALPQPASTIVHTGCHCWTSGARPRPAPLWAGSVPGSLPPGPAPAVGDRPPRLRRPRAAPPRCRPRPHSPCCDRSRQRTL